MQQHPVPQPITSYEFRLVGDMTLKQFLKLAAGVGLALVVYAINPPGIIKWFLVMLFGGLGAAMAFVPFEGRPIDVWIIAFFKRIYSPTQYVWKQRSKSPITRKLDLPPKTLATKSGPETLNPQPAVAGNSQAAPTDILSQATPPSSSPPSSLNTAIFTSDVSASIPSKPAEAVTLKTLIAQKQETPVQPQSTAVEARFAQGMSIPATPSLPNLLTGYIHDQQGKLIEGAILEIRDQNGIPVRAFKTNKLGQFRSATPLPDGVYEIETEKEGFSFDIIRIDLKGKVVPPIEIISK
jgi:hypothetical protein